MDNELPDSTPDDNELEKVISYYGKPSGKELDQALQQRLEQAKQRYIKRQYDRLDRGEREQERGQDISL